MSAAWFDAFVASTGFGPGQQPTSVSSGDVQTPSSRVHPQGVAEEDNFAIPLMSRSGRQQKATLPEQFAPTGVNENKWVPNASRQVGGDVPGLIKTQDLPPGNPGRYRRPPSAALNRQQLIVNKDGLYPSERTVQKSWDAVGVGKAVEERVNLPANLEPNQVISSALRENETVEAAPISGLVAQILGPIMLFVSVILLTISIVARNYNNGIRASSFFIGLLVLVGYFFVNTKSQLQYLSTWWSTWIAEVSATVMFFILLKITGFTQGGLIYSIMFFVAAIFHHIYLAIVKGMEKKEALKESMVVRENLPREAFDREGYLQLDEPIMFPTVKDPMDSFAMRMQRQGTKPLEGPRANFGYQRAPMDPTGRVTMPVSNLMRPGKVMNFDDGAVGEYMRQLGGEMPNQFYQAHPYYTFNANWANRNKIDDGETQFGIASSPNQMNRKWIYRQPKIDQAGAKTSHLKDIAPSAMDPLEKSHPWMSPDEVGEAVLAGVDPTTTTDNNNSSSSSSSSSVTAARSTMAPERFVAEIEELPSDGETTMVTESKNDEEEDDELMRPEMKKNPRNHQPKELPEALRPVETMSERKKRMTTASIPVNPDVVVDERKSDDDGGEEGTPFASFYTDGNDGDEPSSFAGFFSEKKQPTEQDVQREIEMNKKR